MSVVNGYPEPVRDALRVALKDALDKAGVPVEGRAVVTVTNEQFGTLTVSLDDESA